MGYYIQTPENHNKAQQIVEMYGGTLIPQTAEFDERGEGLVCVVNNFIFDAAGFIYDAREFEEFARNDGRPKQWLVMDRNKAVELSGYKG